LQPLHHSISRHPFPSTGAILSRLDTTGRSYKGTYSCWKLLVSSALTCIKSYFFQFGFLDGYRGYLLARYKSHQAFYNQLFARETQRGNPPLEEAPVSDDA